MELIKYAADLADAIDEVAVTGADAVTIGLTDAELAAGALRLLGVFATMLMMTVLAAPPESGVA